MPETIPVMLRATAQDQADIEEIKEYMERTLPGALISQADVLRFSMQTTKKVIENEQDK